MSVVTFWGLILTAGYWCWLYESEEKVTESLGQVQHYISISGCVSTNLVTARTWTFRNVCSKMRVHLQIDDLGGQSDSRNFYLEKRIAKQCLAFIDGRYLSIVGWCECTKRKYPFLRVVIISALCFYLVPPPFLRSIWKSWWFNCWNLKRERYCKQSARVNHLWQPKEYFLPISIAR